MIRRLTGALALGLAQPSPREQRMIRRLTGALALGLALLFASCSGQEAFAQSSLPLSSLTQNTNPQPTDFIPDLASGGSTLQYVTLGQIFTFVQGKLISGTPTAGDCASFAAGALLVDSGVPCSSVTTNVPANEVLAGPTSGSSSTPAYRSLVVADLPSSATAGQVLTSQGAGNPPSYQGLPSNPYVPGLPEQSAWSVLNGSALTVQQSTPTDVNTVQALSLTSPYAGSTNAMGLCRSAPATPYRVVIFVSGTLPAGGESYGFGFYDGTKLETLSLYTADGGDVPGLAKWNSVNSVASTSSGTPTIAFVGTWLAIENDGTTVSFQLGSDGVNWQTGWTDSVASPSWVVNYNTICLYINPQISGSGTYYATWLTYDENGINRTLASVY